MAFEFPHRTKGDRTIDSVCPRCYAFWEADIERSDALHVCEPSQLRYFEEQRRRQIFAGEQPRRSLQVKTV